MDASDETLNFSSRTEAIPKGYGFIVKPTSVVNALSDVNVAMEVYLVRSYGRRFSADFLTPRPNIPYERLFIYAGSARRDELSEFRKAVESESIPKLVEWISGILALDTRSPVRRQDQYCNLLPSNFRI